MDAVGLGEEEGMDYSASVGEPSEGQDRQRIAALFILKAKEIRMLSQDALDGILDDVKG